MIIGTAGHIDHGKTSLVKALTGIDTDRLQEEKRRGITLELGFAHLTLDDGSVAGVVDVPGHERFVKAMAAGAGGVDVAILVVAADEGPMPQTREHLDICRLLDVRAGVIALTKSDLLPELGPEWLELLKSDLATLCAGTFLEGAPIVPCSAKTGDGLALLRTRIGEACRSAVARPSDGPMFLPIDRAFTMKGFGTVVTGTLLSGQLELDAQVSLMAARPGPFRVRGLQQHGHAVDKALAGQRVAVNLTGIEAAEVARGWVLCRHGELPQSRMFDAELSLLPVAEKSLPRRSKLLLHLGTAQLEATIALVDHDTLAPGENGFVQLRLAEPVVALPGQRFILRGAKALPGRGATLAGGRILAAAQARRRRGGAELLQPLAEPNVEGRVTWLLRQAGYRGLTVQELFARSAIATKPLTRALELLGTRGGALLIDKERRLYLSSEVFAGMTARALGQVQAFHQREPMREGLSKEELRQRLSAELDPKIFARVVHALVESGCELNGDLLRIKGRARVLTQSEEGTRARLVAELSAAGLAPPRLDELGAKVGLPGAATLEILKAAMAGGELVRVSEELFFSRRALEDLKERLVEYLRAQGEISTQSFKELVGQSRKFVIPLSEYFDRERVTLRVGEKRVLRKAER